LFLATTNDAASPHVEALGRALDAWQIDYRVLVVDDGSSDGTPDLVEAFGPRFAALRLPANRGKGPRFRAGMLAAGGRIAAFTDADLPYELDSLRRVTNDSCDRRRRGVRQPRAGRCRSSSTRATGQEPLLRRAAGEYFGCSCGGSSRAGHRYAMRAQILSPRGRPPGVLPGDDRRFRLRRRSDLPGQSAEAPWSEIPVVLVNEGESTVSLRRHGPAMLRDLASWPGAIGAGRRSRPTPAGVDFACFRAGRGGRFRAALPSAHLASGSGWPGASSHERRGGHRTIALSADDFGMNGAVNAESRPRFVGAVDRNFIARERTGGRAGRRDLDDPGARAVDGSLPSTAAAGDWPIRTGRSTWACI